MKNNYYILIICLASMMALASCSDKVEEVAELVSYKSDLPKGVQLTFLAVSPNGGANTRTHLESTGDVYWDFEDEISVFSGGKGFYFNTYGSGATVSFSGTVTEEDDNYYALYPHDYEATIEFDGSGVATITTTLPAVQEATQNSFMRDANITVAHTAHAETMTFGFRNVCGLVKFTITSDEPSLPFTKAVLSGLSSENIAGAISIVYDYTAAVSLTNPGVEVKETPTPGKTITLVAPQDETLEKTTYYFVVPPTTFTAGYKITFYVEDTPTAVWNVTGTSAEVQRSKILDAGTYTYEAPVAPTP